jgi:hypothetical protein
MSSSPSIRLEGFDAELRGRRTLMIGSADTWLTRFASVESESLYKGRSVLVIQEGTTKGNGREYPSLQRRRWDCTFRPRDQFDYQMLATYVQNAPKPVRVLWVFPSAGMGADIPRALWQRWANKDITLLGGSESGVIGGCEWESILFPLNCEMTLAERVLNARGTGLSAQLTKIKDHIHEISASGAALAWTNIDETGVALQAKAGGLYWYDPTEGEEAEGESFSREEASQLLLSLAKWCSTGSH